MSEGSATVHTLKFDPAQIQVSQQGQHWFLSSGNKQLKDFGNDIRTAQEAAFMVRSLKLDELTRIGEPAPTMEYWLSNGEAPHLSSIGQRVIRLEPAQLRIEMDPKIGQWVLRNDNRTILAFGQHRQDAQQALVSIRRYGFTHVVSVGQGVASMLVFTGDNRPAFVGAKESGIVQADHKGAPAELHLEPVPTTTAPSPVSQAANNEASDAAVERLRFDYHQAEVRTDNNQCILACGREVLATFGHDESSAHRAQSVLHRYQLNELCRIGGPQSQFTYYLSGGRVPLGQSFGVQSYPLDPANLAVQQDEHGWVLANKDQALWRFSQSAEAQQALATIHNYKFDHVCHVGGSEGTGLTFLVRTH